VRINRPIVAFVGVVPNLFEQVLSREDAAGIRSEQSQQVKLFWGEFNVPVTNCYLAPDWIDPQIPTKDGCFVFPSTAVPVRDRRSTDLIRASSSRRLKGLVM